MAPFDFSTVGKKTSSDQGVIDPVKIFYKLSHPKIDDLRPVQKEILDKWFLSFSDKKNDQIISLDTGAGKTLIGLYIAESIRRKKQGKVLYLCPDNFLVEQVKEQAKEYGIETSSYTGGNWKDEHAFLQNEKICITNYSAVFNPNSIFKKYDIVGCIFDDSHTAIDQLEKYSTLTIEGGKVLNELFALFPNFEAIQGLKDGDPTRLAIIPPLDWWSKIPQIKNILLSMSKSDEFDTSQYFSWEGIKDKLEKTICFCSAQKIEITLLYPELKNSTIFRDNAERIYLSATSSASDEIIKIFGKQSSETIGSENPTYRPDRLFIFSDKVKKFDPEIEEEIHSNPLQFSEKSFVLIPSNKDFKKYPQGNSDIKFSDSSDIKEKIADFKSSPKQALIVANRYDGIDIKGDACHFLIIDNILAQHSLKDRFFSEFLGEENNKIFRSNIASKITQAFGRTTRDSSDYSIILVMGKNLNNLLANKDNYRFFKKDLIEDLEIGSVILDSIENNDQFKDLVDTVLSTPKTFKDFLENRRSQDHSCEEMTEEEMEKRNTLAKKERKIMDFFLENRWRDCILEINKEDFQNLVKECFSAKMLGVYFCIAAFCALKIEEPSTFQDFKEQAQGVSSFWVNTNSSTKGPLPKAECMQTKNICKNTKQMPTFSWKSNNLNFEENLRELGEFLGFKSMRPEKEKIDSTLDVLWVDEEKKVALGFEVKANKENMTLNKGEIGQSLDHLEWIKSKYKDYKRKLYIVGEIDQITSNSNPGKELLILGFNDLEEVTKKIMEIYENKDLFPGDVQGKVNSAHLNAEIIFPEKKVLNLKK